MENKLSPREVREMGGHPFEVTVTWSGGEKKVLVSAVSPVEAAQKGLNQILKRLLSDKRFFHSYVGQMVYSGDLLFRVTDLTLKRKREKEIELGATVENTEGYAKEEIKYIKTLQNITRLEKELEERGK